MACQLQPVACADVELLQGAPGGLQDVPCKDQALLLLRDTCGVDRGVTRRRAGVVHVGVRWQHEGRGRGETGFARAGRYGCC
jgi:hypothetical protein